MGVVAREALGVALAGTMVDTVTPEKRSQVMALVGSKDTRPEMLIRRGLHRLGYRYRLHAKDLPGKPDLVFPRFKSVIQINGCFWHGHSCYRCRMPATNKEYWFGKIAKNRKRDLSNLQQLQMKGWRVLTIWECALIGRERIDLSEALSMASDWLLSRMAIAEIRGKPLHLQV